MARREINPDYATLRFIRPHQGRGQLETSPGGWRRVRSRNLRNGENIPQGPGCGGKDPGAQKSS